MFITVFISLKSWYPRGKMARDANCFTPFWHVFIFFRGCLSVQLSFLEVNTVCLLHHIDLSGVCALADILATIPSWIFMLTFHCWVGVVAINHKLRLLHHIDRKGMIELFILHQLVGSGRIFQ